MSSVSLEGGVGNCVIVNVFCVENNMYMGQSSGDLVSLGEHVEN